MTAFLQTSMRCQALPEQAPNACKTHAAGSDIASLQHDSVTCLSERSGQDEQLSWRDRPHEVQTCGAAADCPSDAHLLKTVCGSSAHTHTHTHTHTHMRLLSKHIVHDCNQIVFGVPCVYCRMVEHGEPALPCICNPNRQGLSVYTAPKQFHHRPQQQPSFLQGRQRQHANCSTDNNGLYIKQAVQVKDLRHNDCYQCNPNAEGTFAVGISTRPTPQPFSS